VALGCTEAEARARAALLDVESYEVSLDLAADPDAVRSRAEIRFRCRRPGAATFADVSAPALSRAACNGQRLDPGASLSGGRLRLPGLAASNVLAVDAVFPYSPGGRGLSRFADPADGGVYVLGSCFPTHAPSVFCCFDQPDLRADLRLTVSAPAGWECVANGAVTDRPAPGQAGVWRFAPVPAMQPYELTLCAGPYVTVAAQDYPGAGGPVRLSVRCRRTLAGSAGLARAGEVVSQALAYYEALLGVPCPYDKYDVVFTPDLDPLGMSMPGVMIVSESLLRRMADPEDDLVAMVLAHEAAHLWFGCLVEGRWWDDLWLAEALATYLSYTALTESVGTDAPWAAFCLRDQEAAYRADSLPSTQPVSSRVDSAADALIRPSAITYSKGASVIRQLAALIGDDALRVGLRAYLTAYRGSATTLADLVGCWSQASGRDLSVWAEQWLRTPGANTLRPELTLRPDGAVRSLAVAQEPPAAPGVLRTHRVTIGMYEREGTRLRRRGALSAEVHGARTAVPAPALDGSPAPDAVIVNDGDLTYARIRFDDRSLRALVACALDVDDPLTEAVCWNAAWDMATSAELSVAEFTDLVARRIGGGRPPAGIAELMEHVLTGADYYALPGQRPGLRQRAADAALDGAGRAQPGSRIQRVLAVGFAASAHSPSQLGLLRSWLGGRSLPDGVTVEEDLLAQILATLSARGLAADEDLDALAAADPAGGASHRATCRALRPDPAAKEEAWTAALDARQAPSLAQAHARGIWAPAQERILAPFRERYFTEALPAVSAREPHQAGRLARLLYPATLADPATITATDAALDRGTLGTALRLVLLEQGAMLRQVLAVRAHGGDRHADLDQD
jgi:aminopeptidase N